jgi:hypothetical protein
MRYVGPGASLGATDTLTGPLNADAITAWCNDTAARCEQSAAAIRAGLAPGIAICPIDNDDY